MMIEWIHPTTFFFIAAFLLPFLKEPARRFVQWVAPLLAFLSLMTVTEGTFGTVSIMGMPVVFGRVDRLSLLFGYVFTISTFIGMIYALHVRQTGEIMTMFFYAGAALGAVFSGDLLTLFLFWEIMAFSSVFLVFYAGPQAKAAGMRYLMIHILGGICLFVGTTLYVAQENHVIAFSAIPMTGLGPALILTGVLINAAAVPLHAWLSDAYPSATITGAVFMSAFTTKTSVYILIRSFAGVEVLIIIGIVMALYGAIYAMIENDIRRILAYGIISQVGYMVAGVGIGSDLALNGASAHAFSHILYKGLLMMAMGCVIFMTGRRKLTELGGLYKSAPTLFVLYLIGALSIAGVPFFSGFVSKSMIISAAGESHRTDIYLLLTLVSSGTFLYTGLRLPYYVFFGEKTSGPIIDPPANMIYAMVLSAIACTVIGLFPGLLYQALPFPVAYRPYTVEHIVSALQLLFLTAAVFFLLKKYLEPKKSISLDLDCLYRKSAPLFSYIVHKPLAQYEGWVTQAYQSVLIAPAKKISQWAWSLDTLVVDGLVNATGFLTLLESRVSAVFDVHVVDGAVNGVSTVLDHSSKKLRQFQTGLIQNYVLAMVGGVAVLATFFVIQFL